MCGQERADEWKRSSVNEDDECSICFEAFRGRNLIKLKCKHVYHAKCLKIWVMNQTTCPLDRTRFKAGVRF